MMMIIIIIITGIVAMCNYTAIYLSIYLSIITILIMILNDNDTTTTTNDNDNNSSHTNTLTTMIITRRSTTATSWCRRRALIHIRHVFFKNQTPTNQQTMDFRQKQIFIIQ